MKITSSRIMVRPPHSSLPRWPSLMYWPPVLPLLCSTMSWRPDFTFTTDTSARPRTASRLPYSWIFRYWSSGAVYTVFINYFHSQNSWAWSLLGHTHFLLEEFPTAREAYERCLLLMTTPPNLHSVYLHLAHIHLSDKKVSELMTCRCNWVKVE